MEKIKMLPEIIREIISTKWEHIPDDISSDNPFDEYLSAGIVGYVKWKRLAHLLRIIQNLDIRNVHGIPMTYKTMGGERVIWMTKNNTGKGPEYLEKETIFDWVAYGFENTYRFLYAQNEKNGIEESKVSLIVRAVNRMPKNYLDYCRMFRPGYPSPIVDHDTRIHEISF